jgi:hypothetical protein
VFFGSSGEHHGQLQVIIAEVDQLEEVQEGAGLWEHSTWPQGDENTRIFKFKFPAKHSDERGGQGALVMELFDCNHRESHTLYWVLFPSHSCLL